MGHLSRRWLTALLVLAVAPLTGLAAQQATVTGRVTTAGEPLGAAQVGIAELGGGAVTDAQF